MRHLRTAWALAVVLLGVATAREGHLIGIVGVVVGVVGAVAVIQARAVVGAIAASALLAAWAVTRAASMPDEVWWRHLEVQRTGQGSLVVLWAVCVVGVLLFVPLRRRPGTLIDVAMVATATLGWVMHPALAVLTVLWGARVMRARTAPWAPPHPVLRVTPALAALVVIADLATTVARTPVAPAADPGASTRRAIERDNPWRALAAAYDWAATGDPQGVLAVARIAASLGLVAEAEAALAVVEGDDRLVKLRGEAAAVRKTLGGAER